MTANTINDAVTMQPGAEGSLLANRYRVVRQLGQGGMGSVWLAEDTQLDGKLFAIKMLPSILVSNKRAYHQLKDEALVAMQLVHPNIVQIRAFEENSGNPFLVMDYIDGETLDDYLAEHCGDVLTQSRRDAESAEGGDGRGMRPACPLGGLPEADVVRILKPIAAALDYAHSKGVVHRDVKPGNVMIARDGTPYILDFGIAREIQETMTRVTGKLSSGTLLYMSPEQLNGDPPKPAQDVYSFSAMVYECLKGEPPFSRGNIEFQIMNKEPEPLVGRDVPIAPLAAGVMAGLAKKPEDRPATCAGVLSGDALTQSSRDAKGQRGNVVGRDDSIAIQTRGPDLLRSEEAHTQTQADCVRLMADAKVVQRHIARLSDDPECKKDILEIEDDFVRADAIFAEKQWALAAECYARIIERGNAVEEAVAHRAAEEKIRREAEEAARREADERARCEVEEKKRREAAERARLAAIPTMGSVKTMTLPGGATMEMIYIAPGSFLMGSPTNEVGRCDDEIQHHVTLTKGFWLGKYQVTQNQWQRVMMDAPSFFKGDGSGNLPVERVSWEDCQKFIRKVNGALDCGARLPTEAEWEYVCRAGTTENYGGTGRIGDMGWHDDAFFGIGLQTHPVGRKRPNSWGFFDMHGNVWEWCNDWYGAYGGDSTDPHGPALGSSRVLRGGSYSSDARICRSASRHCYAPNNHDITIGFRLCCDRMPNE